MNTPGATHKARWMGKLLYTLKIVLLEKPIRRFSSTNFITSAQMTKIKRFVTFVVYIYVPWWLTCADSTGAPSNDLLLMQNIFRFTDIDAPIGQAALKAFKNHLWYLVPDMVPLALFDDNLNDTTRQELANAILQCPKKDKYETRFGESFGKPSFPEINVDTGLQELVGSDSWHFFTLLKIDSSFLSSSVKQWSSNEVYLTGQKISRALKVTNDTAERGVKLASDFLDTAQNEQ